MKKSIYEKIEEKTQETVAEINAKAIEEANKIRTSMLNKATKEVETIKKEAQHKKTRTIDQKKSLYDLERKQSLLKIQNEIIQDSFNEAMTYLEQMSGDDLLSFVANKLKKESLLGDEIIEVNNKDYQKYLNALSSHKEDTLVVLDKLNQALGAKFNLKISNKPSLIDNGFLVISKFYDLNFSLTGLLEIVKKEQEKNISTQLFG